LVYQKYGEIGSRQASRLGLGINADLQGTGDELTDRRIDSTGGFTMVLAGLKAWLEHGIELNLIGDKFPKELMA